ncbi:MAG: heme peroxidase family protein [Planctomycetota bacterium]
MKSLLTVETASLTSASAGTGRFARLFSGLTPQGNGVDPGTIRGWLTSLGDALKDDVDAAGFPFPAGDHPTLPAGYTYLGQFIDHDLTFDPTRLPDSQIDISTLSNFRSPALDLDNLLGFGPGADPILYEPQSAGPRAGRLRTAESLAGNPDGIAHDLPRLGDGTPLIGDPRNDENLFVGQLHTAFITFFNKIFVDLTAGSISDLGPVGGSTSEKAARIARWHYQWIVLNDFLPRILEGNILSHVIACGPYYYHPDPTSPYMPVEFSGAAYRLGHSMVRERYHVNGNFGAATLGDLFNFSSSGGGVPVPPSWFINWNRLFEIDAATTVNLARRLDPYAAPTLHNLPNVPPPASLAVRNLLRGWSWGLPSGQSIATLLGVPVLTPGQILADADGQRCKEAGVVEPFNFHNDTPLWYYILKESQALHRGELLGPVGSTILAEVFVGLLRADPESFLSVNPGWTPTLPGATAGQFTMVDLFRYLPPAALNPNGGDTGAL